MKKRMRSASLAVVGLVFMTTAVRADAKPPKKVAGDPVAVAGAYFEALEAKNLDRAGRLFHDNASIYESGGVEGTWEHYRSHHLGPELGEVRSFQIKRKKNDVAFSADRSMAVVGWSIGYTIILADGRTLKSNGTVTFVLLNDGQGYRIRHLHWSSRKKKKHH